MSHNRTMAVVLRRTDYSETSLVVALLTEDGGRRSAMVKGAKRPKSPFFGALDLYSLNEVVMLERRSSDLAIMTEASVVDVYAGLRRDLKNAYAAHAMAELLLGTVEENEPVPEVFELTCRTLGLLAEADPEAAEAHLAAFEVKLLKHLGLELVLDRCALCEKPIENGTNLTALSMTSGGTVCTECAARAAEVMEVSAGTIKVLKALEAVRRIWLQGCA